jgi:hypothetical protein
MIALSKKHMSLISSLPPASAAMLVRVARIVSHWSRSRTPSVKRVRLLTQVATMMHT